MLVIRAPVWVFLEPQPGVMDNDIQGTRLPARQALIEVSKTIMEGMVYGWKISYTPFDKLRAVEEEFELEPLQSIRMTSVYPLRSFVRSILICTAGRNTVLPAQSVYIGRNGSASIILPQKVPAAQSANWK